MKVSMSAVWDRTAEFLGDNLVAVAGVAALTMFVPAVITESLVPLKQPGGTGLSLGLGILSLVLGIVTLWGQLTIMTMAIDPVADVPAARAHATRRLGPMILVALAMLAVALVLVLPVIGTLIANGVDPVRFGQPGAAQTLTPGAGAFIVLYALFVLLPLCLWLVARFAVLATPVVMAENQMLGALGRAYRLSQGLTWRIIGVLLLYGIVMLVATLAAVTVAGAIFAFTLRPEGAISVASVLTAVVGALVTTAFSLIGTVFPAKLYLAVRDRERAATP